MKKYPFEKQIDLKDCGVACLSMIIKYYGGYINKYKLLMMTNTDKNGTTGYDLVKSAKEIGFDSCGIRCDIEDIQSLNLPLIAYTLVEGKYKHYMVIYEINLKKNYIYIADPATKLVKMDLDKFKTIYQGVVFIFKPIREITKEVKHDNFIKKYLKNNMKNLINIFIFSFLTIIVNFIVLNNIKAILDSKGNIKTIFLICLLFQFIKSLLLYIKNRALVIFSEKMNFEFMMDTFLNIISLPYSYYRRKTTGEIASRMQDINQIKQDLTHILITIFLDSFLVLSTGIFLYFISPFLFSIIIFFLIINIILIFTFKNKLEYYMKKVKQKNSLIDSYVVESVSGFESVKGQNLENNIISNFKRKLEDYTNYSLKFESIYNRQIVLKESINDICTLLIITFGSLLVSRNSMTIGTFLIFQSLYSYFIDPFKNIINIDYDIKNVKNIIERIEELKYAFKKKENYLPQVKEIKFSNVYYTHNNIDFILNGISFKIKNNDKIIIFGENGSGKSTILKLIKGYYNSKNILVNGSYRDISSKVIYISQNEYLFTDSIYENIIFNRKIDKKDFLKIADIVGIDSIVDKNIGYDKLIEENGFNISGGEKQRIVLARALLSKFDVLLIDEGMSEIDVNSERQILKEIMKLYKNKIIIFVSHRKDNMDLFNKAMHLDEDIKIITK